MRNITYRKATLDDCYSIAELKGVVWNTTYKGIYPDEKLTGYDVGKNEQIFQTIVNNPEIEIYVATDQDRIGEVKRLFIKNEYRGKGISKELLKTAEHYAKEQGCTKLFLDTRITLEPAVSIYLSWGFNIVFQQGLYIQMEKKI